jgi:hypothetical protein
MIPCRCVLCLFELLRNDRGRVSLGREIGVKYERRRGNAGAPTCDWYLESTVVPRGGWHLVGIKHRGGTCTDRHHSFDPDSLLLGMNNFCKPPLVRSLIRVVFLLTASTNTCV